MRLLVYSLFHPMISLRCNLSLLSRFCKDTEVCPRKDTERHTWVQGLTVMRHFAQEVSTAKKRRKSWKPFLNKGGPNSNNFKGEGTFGVCPVCLLLCWYSFENTSGICKNFKFPVVLAVNWFQVEKMLLDGGDCGGMCWECNNGLENAILQCVLNTLYRKCSFPQGETTFSSPSKWTKRGRHEHPLS